MKFILIIVAAVLGSSGVVLAQSDGKQPPAKQSAPAESSDAPGHDAQTGKPETGEKQRNDARNQEKRAVPDQGAQRKQKSQTAAPPK